MYSNVIDFGTAMSRARDLHADAERARLARALVHNSKVTFSGASSARRRIGGLVVRLGERIGGAEPMTGPALVASRVKSPCA